MTLFQSILARNKSELFREQLLSPLFCSQAVMELLVIYPLAVGGRRLPGLPCPAGAALLLSQQKLMPLTGQRC